MITGHSVFCVVLSKLEKQKSNVEIMLLVVILINMLSVFMHLFVCACMQVYALENETV